MELIRFGNEKFYIVTASGQAFEIQESTGGIFVRPVEPFNRIRWTFLTPVCIELEVREKPETEIQKEKIQESIDFIQKHGE